MAAPPARNTYPNMFPTSSTTSFGPRPTIPSTTHQNPPVNYPLSSTTAPRPPPPDSIQSFHYGSMEWRDSSVTLPVGTFYHNHLPPPPAQAQQQPLPPPQPPPRSLYPFVTSPSAAAAPPPDALQADHSKIIERHESLQDSREDLMGTRFRMQAKRRRVRAVREQTGQKEGIAIRLLREWLLEQDVQLPRAVDEAWEEVHASRDQLGMLEGEYDNVEGEYHEQEIKYTAGESDFVNTLVISGPPPKVMVPPDASVRKAGLFTHAVGSPDGWSTESPETEAGRAEINEKIIEPQRLSRPASSQSWPTVQQLAPGEHDHTPPLLTTEYMERRYPHASPGVDATKKQVDDWLFEIISKSRVQKAQMWALDTSNCIDQDEWWKAVKRTWNRHSSAATQQLHTGDSTFSQAIGSQPPPSAADLDIAGIQDLDMTTPQSRSLLPNELALDLDEPSLPPRIDPNDLWEARPTDGIPLTSQEFKADNTTPSVSTEPATTDKTFGTGEVASITTLEGAACPCRKCRKLQVPSFRDDRTSWSMTHTDSPPALRQERSPLATPKQHATTENVVNDNFLPIAPVDNPKPRSAPSESLIPEWPSELVDDSDIPKYDLVSQTNGHIPHSESQHQSEQSPSLDISPQSASWKPTFQLPFPFLRLTPRAIVSKSSDPKQQNLPFIAFHGHTPRLPGPASDDM